MNREIFDNIANLITTANEYTEFRDSDKVKDKMHLLTVSGSIAYGTNHPDSDIDIRGIVGLEKEYACGAKEDWQTNVFKDTDTVIHSYKKAMHLLAKGNPDSVVLVGLRPEDYLYLSPIGRELVDKHSDFLSADGIYHSFVGYANAQLRRLELAEIGRSDGNKRVVKDKKESILKNATFNFHTKYTSIQTDNLKMSFVVPEDPLEKVMIRDLEISNISLDDYFDVARDIKNIVKSFGTKGKREKKEDFKLNKHCMHTIRGMLTGIETLETGRVVTYREKDLPLLKSILDGDYMNEDGKMRSEFYELVDEMRTKADYAYKHSVLPNSPDVNKQSDMLIAFFLDDMKRIHNS